MGDLTKSVSQRLKKAQQTLSTHVAALSTRARQRPRVLWGAAAALLLAGAGAGAVAYLGPDEVLESATELVGAKPVTLAELKAKAKEHPNDAAAHLELGHAYFAASSRALGVKEYGRALGIDSGVADDKLASNLLGCFGKSEQGKAASLLGKHKVNAAVDGLITLSRGKSASSRRDAVKALEKMGKSALIDYAKLYELDLDSPDCDVKRRAVEKLAKVGDRGSIAVLRKAAEKDDDETPWYKSSCLGKLPEEAEKKIASRK